MRGWTSADGELDLDHGDPCPAEYMITVEEYRGRFIDLLGCKLERWTFGERNLDRATAVILIGDGEVCRQEQVFAALWWDKHGNHRVAAQ